MTYDYANGRVTMVQVESLLLPLLMGVFLAGVVAYLLRNGPVRSLSTPDRDVTTRLTNFAHHPATWVLGFLVLAVGFGGGIILYISDDMVSSEVNQAVGIVLAVAAVGTFAGFLFSGVYGSARARGLTSAQATMVGGWGIALLFLGAIVLKLVTAG